MADLALALDLGTGGCKASLWDSGGRCRGEVVTSCPTAHPRPGWHEQRPEDWWDAAVSATRALLADDPRLAQQVVGVALSGHSLGAVLLDGRGELVEDTTPLWSDGRAGEEAREFFSRVDESRWYAMTGNGFSPPLYPLFTAMWFRRHRPQAWARTRHLLGSKDYLNLRLTGEVATDPSYASGSGCFDLRIGRYDADLAAAAGLDERLLPGVRASTDVVGPLTAEAAGALRLAAGTPVFTGGVDNACMALGSLGNRPGRAYAALGSSSWITVTTTEPVVDEAARPFVFAHVVPGLHVSALSTFSSGTTMAWLADLVAPGTSMADLVDEGCTAPLGARGLLFLPMLAGGTPLEGGADARGVLHGLDLSHRRPDVVRAAMEGIAAALRRSRDAIARLSARTAEAPEGDLVVSGGGSRHPGWNQVYADVLGVPLVRTAVDQQAAALGAAATAFVGAGTWDGFDAVERPHEVLERYDPVPARAEECARLCRRFDEAVRASAALTSAIRTTAG